MINIKIYKGLILFAAIVGMFSADLNAQYRQSVTRTMTTTVDGVKCRSASSQSVEVYDIATVDVQPAFPGGMNALYNYINKSRRYPAEAYQNGVQGRVLCSFIVDSDGSVTNVSVIKGIEPSLDNEALRIIEEMPDWEAGRVDNKAVPIYCILPIIFRL